MTEYTIKIINHSGRQQRYAIFNEAPNVSGLGFDKVWPTVMKATQTFPDSSLMFKISRRHYSALCGIYDTQPAEHVAVTVSDTKAVKLGSRMPDGTETKGMSWRMDVVGHFPLFTKLLPPHADANAYEIVTGDSFSYDEAMKSNYMIGLGNNMGDSKPSVAATFIAFPNTHYQITPHDVFYATFGEYMSGQTIDPTKLGNVFKVDYNSLDTTNVVIVHNPDGKLEFQK